MNFDERRTLMALDVITCCDDDSCCGDDCC
jgi:hypothetical protein